MRRWPRDPAKRLFGSGERGPPGDIYFVACQNQFVKVGFTNFDVERRIAELQTGCPHELTLIGVLRAHNMCAEKWFHQAMRVDHHRLEWFNLNDRARLMVHHVNSGFYPASAEEVALLYLHGHEPEVAKLAPRLYLPSAPDPDPESCSTPA